MAYGDRFQEPDENFEPECDYECIGCKRGRDTECDGYISDDEYDAMKTAGFDDIGEYRTFLDGGDLTD